MEWLNGWGNRALVEITYPTAGGQTYYQTSLTVNYKPDMQIDFDDVRFTLSDGITELSYFKDTYVSATSALFWVKAPLVLPQPKITVMYMYWNNDGVSTTSSPQNTFLRVIDNTMCYWNFDEASGTVVYDKLPSNVSGTLYGGATRILESGYDKSVYFDGVNDYMSWTYTKPSNNFSISFWVKAITTHGIDTESATGTAGMVGQKYVFGTTHEGANAGFGISLGTNGISVYGHGTDYMAPLAVASVSVGTGWRHIAVTVTNKQPRIYLNGALARTGLTCTKTYLYAPTRLGGDASYGYFNGYVNDVCIFNSVLTSTEIGDLYTKEACYYTQNYQGVLVRKYVDPEPEVAHVAYTTGNICAKTPYVFSCSVSGVNVHNTDTLDLINSVEVDKLSTVWANDDYLFAGTSNSGIYKFDLSTIVSAPVAEIYKQYPDLTSNNIRYLNGGGNYLCAVTLSGVDRYNINTGSRKLVNVVGANKCFQASTGDFYFDLYTDLVAMYDDNAFFIYTPEEGNILQSYGIYDSENTYIIHDIFVTVGTSANNSANTIFLATANGVVVIEEKRGDEENARRRYYKSRYDLYTGEGQEEEIDVVYKGYIMGYSTIIEALNFVNESSSVVSVTLSSNQTSGAGVNSSIKGYILGGLPGLSMGKIITAFTFNTELPNVTLATLSTKRFASTGVNNTIKGYVMSGMDASYVSIIESLTFSVEASDVITATLDLPTYYGTGVSSTTKGYCMGGYSGGSLISIEALVFDVETSAIISATLNVGKYGGTGVNSITKGYFFGGITSTYIKAINAISFATEVCSLLAATLSVNNSYGAGINNSTKGYCLGGSTGVVYVNNIERMIFDTEAVSVLSATLSTTRYGDVGVQSGSL